MNKAICLTVTLIFFSLMRWLAAGRRVSYSRSKYEDCDSIGDGSIGLPWKIGEWDLCFKEGKECLGCIYDIMKVVLGDIKRACMGE